jgi:hypothetical protein
MVIPNGTLVTSTDEFVTLLTFDSIIIGYVVKITLSRVAIETIAFLANGSILFDVLHTRASLFAVKTTNQFVFITTIGITRCSLVFGHFFVSHNTDLQ